MRIVNDLNIKKQAEDLGIAIWQTPSFLFLMMGLITAIAMTATYYVSRSYASPEILIISETIVVITIFIVGTTIIRGMEEVARANKMKSEFVSIASHQLRTPLSAIRWEAELLLSKYSEGLSEKHIDTIRSMDSLTKRMVKLVNDLLDVARIDQGAMILKKQKVDINKITKRAIDNFLLSAKAHNIQIVFSPQKIPNVMGDEGRIKLVIENLLDNAIKYISDHGKIKISTEKEDGFIIFSIVDNGVGIPDDQQSRIFNKFFRSDNAVKYQTEGTGLGLYIAKNIIEQSKGKIWFTSKEGVGTAFHFSLPIIK